MIALQSRDAPPRLEARRGSLLLPAAACSTPRAPSSSSPGISSTPSRRRGAAVRRHPRFHLRPGRRRRPIDDGRTILLSGTHGRRVRCSAPPPARSRRSTSGGCSRTTARCPTCTSDSTGRAPVRRTAAAASQWSRAEPDATTHRRDAGAGRVHLRLLRGELLLRGAVQLAWTAISSSSASRRPPKSTLIRPSRGSTRRWRSGGVSRPDAGASGSSPPSARAAPCSTAVCSPRPRRRCRRFPRSSST